MPPITVQSQPRGAPREGILARIEWEEGRLRQLPLTSAKRSECIRTIRALEAELDALDDTVAM